MLYFRHLELQPKQLELKIIFNHSFLVCDYYMAQLLWKVSYNLTLDIINYNHIVRCLTEWTATNQNGVMDQTSIKEGIGGYVIDSDPGVVVAPTAGSVKFGVVNTRQKYIQGITNTVANGTPAHFTAGAGFNSTGDTNLPGGSSYPAGSVVRRYQVNFALGLFTQDKLIPVKFMA